MVESMPRARPATAGGHDLRYERRLAVALSGIMLAIMSTCAAASAGTVAAYNVETPTIRPQTVADRGQQYLIYNLNPIRKQTVTITDVVSNTSPSATAPASPKSGAFVTISVDDCVNAPAVTTCEADLQKITTQLQTIFSEVTSTEGQNLPSIVASRVDAGLNTFDPKALANATTLGQAQAAYKRFIDDLVSPTNSLNGDIGKLLGKYRSDTVRQKEQDAAAKIDRIAGATGSFKGNDATRIKADLDITNGALKQLDSSAVTTVTASADGLANQWFADTLDTRIFFKAVDAPCVPRGFKVETYTIKVTDGANEIWHQEIDCAPEFQVGAMFYADFLDTSTYSLMTPAGGGTPVISQQHNNYNQGSIAGIIHWCPGDQGGNAACISLAGSTNTNGLDVLIGGGYLFAHRQFGLHAGMHIAPINVLSSGYSLGQAVPSGTTFSRKQTSIGSFVGLTINTK